MEYSFNLNWDDIPEELREEKITLYLEREWECDAPPLDLDDYTENPSNRESAENSISAHFPIYF